MQLHGAVIHPFLHERIPFTRAHVLKQVRTDAFLDVRKLDGAGRFVRKVEDDVVAVLIRKNFGILANGELCELLLHNVRPVGVALIFLCDQDALFRKDRVIAVIIRAALLLHERCEVRTGLQFGIKAVCLFTRSGNMRLIHLLVCRFKRPVLLHQLLHLCSIPGSAFERRRERERTVLFLDERHIRRVGFVFVRQLLFICAEDVQNAGVTVRREGHGRIAAHFIGFLIVLIRFRRFHVIRHLLLNEGIVFRLDLLRGERNVLELIVLQELLHVVLGDVLAQEINIILIRGVFIVHVVGGFFEDQLHRARIHIDGGIGLRFRFGLRTIVAVKILDLRFDALLQLLLLRFVKLAVTERFGLYRNELCLHEVVDDVIHQVREHFGIACNVIAIRSIHLHDIIIQFLHIAQRDRFIPHFRNNGRKVKIRLGIGAVRGGRSRCRIRVSRGVAAGQRAACGQGKQHQRRKKQGKIFLHQKVFSSHRLVIAALPPVYYIINSLQYNRQGCKQTVAACHKVSPHSRAACG